MADTEDEIEEKKPEEKKPEEEQPQEQPEPEEEQEEPLTSAEDALVSGEAEDLDFGEGLLDPETGKLLGKFNDTNALARSYKELESHSGRTSQQAAEYKKALEEQGWTFDGDGKPVAPKIAEPVVPEQQQHVQEPALPNGQRVVDGVLQDHLGLPVVTDEEWAALEEEDPAAYDQVRRQYDTLKIVRQEEYSRNEGTRRQQAYEASVQNVRKVAKEQFFLEDDNIAKIEAGVAEVLSHVHPNIRNTPQAYEMAARAVASDLLPGIYKQQLADVISGNKEAVAKAQRVVALEKGTQNAPPPKVQAGYGLTAAEKQMAKDLGVSEKDYAANK